jgi:hypothetical protein
MPHWTIGEQTRLIEAHRTGFPSADILAPMFPRHTRRVILQMASVMGLRSRKERWRRIAWDHFNKRAAECGATCHNRRNA